MNRIYVVFDVSLKNGLKKLKCPLHVGNTIVLLLENKS